MGWDTLVVDELASWRPVRPLQGRPVQRVFDSFIVYPNVRELTCKVKLLRDWLLEQAATSAT